MLEPEHSHLFKQRFHDERDLCFAQKVSLAIASLFHHEYMNRGAACKSGAKGNDIPVTQSNVSNIITYTNRKKRPRL